MYTESFNEKNDLEAISVSARKAFNLDFAINAAQTELTNLQTDQGYWHFELEADCSITADYILMMHYFGEENDSLQEQMATYLRARQTENGSYSLFTGGTDDLSCSVKVYFALKLAGDKTTSLHMVKLKNYILFIFKIFINCTFSNTCNFCNLAYRYIYKSLLNKKVTCRFCDIFSFGNFINNFWHLIPY